MRTEVDVNWYLY